MNLLIKPKEGTDSFDNRAVEAFQRAGVYKNLQGDPIKRKLPTPFFVNLDSFSKFARVLKELEVDRSMNFDFILFSSGKTVEASYSTAPRQTFNGYLLKNYNVDFAGMVEAARENRALEKLFRNVQLPVPKNQVPARKKSPKRSIQNPPGLKDKNNRIKGAIKR